MPAMYPEELRDLREQNPGLQYDFRGRLIDDGGYGDSLRNWSPYRQESQNGGLLASLVNAAQGGILRSQVDDLFYGSRPDDGGSVLEQDWNRLYGPQFAADVVSRAVQGLGEYSYQNGLPEPNASFYSQWDPGTNSWVRHGSPSDGGGLGVSRSGFRLGGGGLGASSPRSRGAAGQTNAGDPFNLNGWTPYEQNFGTGKRDLWRGSPEQTETFPNYAYQP